MSTVWRDNNLFISPEHYPSFSVDTLPSIVTVTFSQEATEDQPNNLRLISLRLKQGF